MPTKRNDVKEFAIGSKIEYNSKLYEVVKSSTCEDCSIANICSSCDRSSGNAIGDVLSRDQRVSIFGECSEIHRSDDTSIVFKELVDDNSNEEFYKVIPLYIDNNSIELRPVEFDLPKGYEIDKERSDLSKGIIKFKNKWLTLEQLYKNYKNRAYHFVYRDSIKDFSNNKLVAIANLMDIASYFNKCWDYDFIKGDIGYMIVYDATMTEPRYIVRKFDSVIKAYYGNPIFKNKADAQYVIDNPNFRDILDSIFKI